MRTWHPESWSVQARDLADRFFAWEDKEAALRGLHNSYRCPLIRQRAIKRFIRKYKKMLDKQKKI